MDSHGTAWLERKAYVARVHALAAQFPVVCILGPRQCGKTTLARRAWPDLEYLDLELPSDFDKLAIAPELFLTTRRRPIIIDEAQRFPEVFALLRALVDRHRSKKGQYILLGSASFRLVRGINESLSGRVAFLDLTPLTAQECVSTAESLEAHWLKGGFPDAYLQGPRDELSHEWFEHYTRTLIDRDLPALGIDTTPLQFRRLWQMCAHAHGGLLNMNKMAESLGNSPHTVGRYLDILEQSFLIRRLPSFHANTKKRLVKSPKLYMRDSGMLHYFLRIADRDTLLVSPERGKSFEGYCVEQVLNTAQLHTPVYDAYFLRTSDQYEADLVLAAGRRRIVIEIKVALSTDRRDVARVEQCMELVRASRGFILTMGSGTYPLGSSLSRIGIEDWMRTEFEPFWER